MRVYFINLDSHHKRRSHMERQLRSLPTSITVERFPAKDAKIYTETKLPSRYNPNGKNSYFPKITYIEIAIFESHRQVWQKISSSNDQHAIILEDDVFLSKDFGSVVLSLQKSFNGYSMIKLDECNDLEAIFGPAEVIGNLQLRRILGNLASAGCYMISKDFSKSLLEMSSSYCCAVDNFLFRPMLRHKIMQSFPAIAIQGIQANTNTRKNLDSQISDSQREKSKFSRYPEKPAYKINYAMAYSRLMQSLSKKIIRAMHKNKFVGTPRFQELLEGHNLTRASQNN